MSLSQVKSQDPSTRLVMTYRQLLSAIKAALQTLGYDTKRYGTHSLRIGLATALAQLGFKRTQIQAVARWTSDTYLVSTSS